MIDQNTIEIMKQAFERFCGTGMYVALFIMSILYILLNKQKKVIVIFSLKKD